MPQPITETLPTCLMPLVLSSAAVFALSIGRGHLPASCRLDGSVQCVDAVEPAVHRGEHLPGLHLRRHVRVCRRSSTSKRSAVRMSVAIVSTGLVRRAESTNGSASSPWCAQSRGTTPDAAGIGRRCRADPASSGRRTPPQRCKSPGSEPARRVPPAGTGSRRACASPGRSAPAASALARCRRAPRLRVSGKASTGSPLPVRHAREPSAAARVLRAHGSWAILPPAHRAGTGADRDQTRPGHPPSPIPISARNCDGSFE